MSNRRTEETWLSNEARKLRIPREHLRGLLGRYLELRSRLKGRDYCESCGVKVRDDNEDDFVNDDYMSDEEGLDFCQKCWDGMVDDAKGGSNG